MSYYNIRHKKAEEIIKKNNIIIENQVISLYYKKINKKALYDWNEKQIFNLIILGKLDFSKPI